MMNNKTQSHTSFTVATTQKISANGEVAVHSQVIKRPVEVIITLGIFFDGTANNARNTLKRKEYEQQLASNQPVEKIGSIYDTSYCNEDSNVYKLFEMYAFGDKLSMTCDDNIARYQQRIYIEGVGTETGEADNYISLGTGFGNRGINAKIARAIAEIKIQLSDFTKDNPKIKIKQIQFDVFGFSRGAATARYFANIVADQLTGTDRSGENNPFMQEIWPLLAPYRSREWQTNLNGQVRFLGIFDTVAGMCSPTNLFDAGDANTFNIDLHIRKQTAQSGLHLQADNEYRYNFSLNDVPVFFAKVMLPGAHSDIGGGYPDTPVTEDIYLCPLYQKTAVKFVFISEAKQQIRDKLQRELIKLCQHPSLKYMFHGLNESHIRIWEEQGNNKDLSVKNIYGVIRYKRTVKAGYDRIPLRIMYDEAVAKGCRFISFLDKYAIPNALYSVANKLLSAAKQYQHYSLNEAEKQLVLGQYVHSSSEYERSIPTIMGTKQIIDQRTGQQVTIAWPQKKSDDNTYSKPSLIKVHAPHRNSHGDWQRIIHPN